MVESRSLAIRVNDRFLIGDIQDRTSLAIRLSGGQEIGIEFTLYVVPKQPGRGPSAGEGAVRRGGAALMAVATATDPVRWPR